MQEFTAQVLYRPESSSLAYLPEGPYPCGVDRASWVAIQHGPDSMAGSLNVYDFTTRANQSFPLQGRPGFAFPTDQPDRFVIGLERRLVLFGLRDGTYEDLCPAVVDEHVSGTIINDGVAFDEGLIFGCKDLAFRERKAGLYFWRRQDGALIQLRSDQICSNGKIIVREGGSWRLLDIDSPTKTVVAYRLDTQTGRLDEPKVVLDLRDDEAFPDGMIATPDGRGVIIAFYNPNPVEFGEVREYDLASGRIQTVWRLPGSPRATCPQLLRLDGQVRLLVTTAVEHMPAEQREACLNAGCLFVAETSFNTLPETPVLALGGPDGSG